jgi:hypothetical protein
MITRTRTRIKRAYAWLRAFTILMKVFGLMEILKAQEAACGQCFDTGYQYWGGQDQYEVKPCDKCGQNSQE